MIRKDFMVDSPDLAITGIRKDGARMPVSVDGVLDVKKAAAGAAVFFCWRSTITLSLIDSGCS